MQANVRSWQKIVLMRVKVDCRETVEFKPVDWFAIIVRRRLGVETVKGALVLTADCCVSNLLLLIIRHLSNIWTL